MRNASISRKEKRKKIIPTEYYFANILLTFYFLGLGPSNIDFPPQFTPEIDMVSFFQFPVPPCRHQEPAPLGKCLYKRQEQQNPKVGQNLKRF